MKIKLLIPSMALGFSLNTLAFTESLHSPATKGMDVAAADVSFQEEKLERDPHDLVSRTKLLGNCFDHVEDRSAQEKHANRVLWLISDGPEAAVLGIPEGTLEPWRCAERYADGRKAWLEQIEHDPSNTALLGHAAAAFTPHSLEVAAEPLQRAQSLDGSNPAWPQNPGSFYMLDARIASGKTKNLTAAKALAQLERAFNLSEGSAQEFLLVDLARTAFTAGEHKKARECQEAALCDTGEGWNQGNRTHFGNVTLGRIALAEGNVEEARYRLVASATTDGPSQLNSFGPDMTLAEELLDAGEREVLLKYVELCSSFLGNGPRRASELDCTGQRWQDARLRS